MLLQFLIYGKLFLSRLFCELYHKTWSKVVNQNGRAGLGNGLEGEGITNLDLAKDAGVAFDDVLGRVLGCVMGSPGFGQHLIYDPTLCINPNHAQIKKDKKHVDGTVKAICFLVNQNQTIIGGKVTTPGEAAQFAEEAITPSGTGNENAAAICVDDLFIRRHTAGVYLV